MTSPAVVTLSLSWWNELEDQWKKAFNEAVWQKGAVLDAPNEKELEWLATSPALRFAGPRAPYPNMSFELSNLSGLVELKNAEILVLTYHSLRSIEEVANMKRLQSLFVNNNLIRSLDGIQPLRHLGMLYAQYNELSSIEQVRKLTKLREVYLHDNQLTSLEGLREEHTKAMETFIILPNKQLPDKEVLRVENKVGIRCRRIG